MPSARFKGETRVNCLDNYLKNNFIHSDQKAIVFYEGLKSLNNPKDSISFEELYQRVIKAQKLLQSKNLQKGDTLLLFEAPTPNLYAIILGALGLGLKLMIIEPWMKADKINLLLKKIQPQALLTKGLGKLVLARAKETKNIKHKFNTQALDNFTYDQNDKVICVEMNPEDHAILTFTTGTSGAPKGVHRKHGYLVDQQNVLKKYLDYEKYPKLDLTVFTNVVLLNLSLGKGSLIINPKWTDKSIRELDELPLEFQVDTTAMGPAFLKKLLKLTSKLQLESFHLGGALADNDLYESALKRWPNAQMHHIYGSTEAEPVSIIDLKVAVAKSKEAGYFQTLYIGNPIEEISTLQKNGSLWVSGPHVSPMYENDDEANKKNKYQDDKGIVWHNMGDQIIPDKNGHWYQGRDFQTPEDFKLEQEVYSYLQDSKSFVKRINNKPVLFGEDLSEKKEKLLQQFPQLNDIIERKIIRDVRHRARIDRNKSFDSGVPMKNILEFIKIRVPVIANLILGFGLVFSAQAALDLKMSIGSIVFAVLGLVLFMTELRFMDELKDFEKDKVAHPDRPLPSGLITTKQVGQLINLGMALHILWCALGFIVFGKATGTLFSITTIWLYLMYKEFFVGEALAKSPLIYAITHQIIIVPICLFVISLLPGAELFGKTSIGLCLIVLSSFFSFEVGRKMDPHAHPILGTYLIHYKKMKTNILITVLLSLSLIGAVMLDKLLWVLIPFILIVLTQIRIAYQAEKFKDLEGLISLNLIYNIWFLAIAGWIA